VKAFRVLVINPGSTSTKTAVYEGQKELLNSTIRHDHSEFNLDGKITDQFDFRARVIEKQLTEKNIALNSLDAVIGRGGLLRPVKGGVIAVNDSMINDLRKAERGEHASNLGALIAKSIADKIGKPAFIVDPVVVDELEPLARISGIPEIERISIFHALNQKATARRAAQELGKDYDKVNLIVAHLGGGISIGAHKKGRVVDVNNALDGDGPLSPERSGGVPIGQLVKMCFSGKFSEKEIKTKIKGKGGLMAYLGTADAREVEKMVDQKNEKAELVYKAMSYQIAKEIGSLAAVLCGHIDGIVLTGGLVYDKRLTEWITSHISFLGKVFVYPGEDEMEALRDGGLRVLSGEEKASAY